MLKSQTLLPEGTYLVTVRSLYASLLPTLTITLAFVCVGVHVAVETSELVLTLLLALGVATILVRLGILLFYSAKARAEALDLSGAHQLERVFAISYISFAAALGTFAARAFQIGSAESHMLVIGLLFGYAAGVASTIYLRPWIALPSMILAVVPTSAVALTTRDLTYVGAGALLLLFLITGIHSTLGLYRTATNEITTRRTFALLARSDALTGLENRLSLREAFQTASARTQGDGIVAVHCLDLDRFKAVNDTYGHPVGDALLRAVSDRLRSVLRAADVAARIGGDEFVVLQMGESNGEAELHAQRIAKAIAEPYSIEGHYLSIGTSVGYALHPEHGRDLDELIACADEALIRVKRSGGGVSMYVPKAFNRSGRRCTHPIEAAGLERWAWGFSLCRGRPRSPLRPTRFGRLHQRRDRCRTGHPRRLTCCDR